ncbi:MAG: hypothetical protein V7K26_31020 [Nostoc sp.]|uniref:hypothetical protein n=1 Tax=Nostoc sp. TaxID=1180 RepID=UPI002FF4204C
MDVWNLGKLGVVIVGAIALSGNSAIATINQGVTLKNNLNAPTLNTAIKKHNTCAIALSGNSAIAKINQDVALDNNLNVPTLNTAIKKHNTLGNDALKINYSIKQTHFQNRYAVDKKKPLIIACRPICCCG